MENAEFWQEFFQLYKDMPALWRVGSTAYTDRVLKTNCYLKLIEKLKDIYPDADRELVVKKINNFRTSYRKELKRLRESKEIGKAYKPTLWYFDCLRFLDDQHEGFVDKSIKKDGNAEEKLQYSQNTSAYKNFATKRIYCKDNGEEISASSTKRTKQITHHFQENQPRQLSHEQQQEAKIDAEILAKSWGVQYKELMEDQKLIARKMINDILFYGCIGALDMSHIIDMQEILQKEKPKCWQHFKLSPHSAIESPTTSSSVCFVEQDLFNTDMIKESSIEFNNSSPLHSPTTENYVDEFQVNDIKFEVP